MVENKESSVECDAAVETNSASPPGEPLFDYYSKRLGKWFKVTAGTLDDLQLQAASDALHSKTRRTPCSPPRRESRQGQQGFSVRGHTFRSWSI